MRSFSGDFVADPSDAGVLGNAGSFAASSAVFAQATAALVTSPPYRIPSPRTLFRSTLRCGTAPAGAPLTVLVKVDGTTAVTLSIADGSTTADVDLTELELSEGALVTVQTTSEGATPATGVTVQLDWN
jgi:hypothetical protein